MIPLMARHDCGWLFRLALGFFIGSAVVLCLIAWSEGKPGR